MAGEFRGLRVWQGAMELVQHVYAVSRAFPQHELFGLTSQLRRAAVSVPSNIAEGHGRGSRAEFAHHLSIARGSLSEVDTQVELAVRLRYVTAAEVQALNRAISLLGPSLIALRQTLTGDARDDHPPPLTQ